MSRRPPTGKFITSSGRSSCKVKGRWAARSARWYSRSWAGLGLVRWASAASETALAALPRSKYASCSLSQQLVAVLDPGLAFEEGGQIDCGALNLARPELEECAAFPRDGVIQILEDQSVIRLPSAFGSSRFCIDIGEIQRARAAVNARSVGLDNQIIQAARPGEIAHLLVEVGQFQPDLGSLGPAFELP